MRWHIIALIQIVWCSATGDVIHDGCTNTSSLSVGLPLVQENNSSCRQQSKTDWRHSNFFNNLENEDPISARSLPRLFSLDHYERCLSRPGATFCLLDLHLANEPGNLYEYIKEYSSETKKHYDRGSLHRGVCISERCGLDAARAREGSELLACMNHTAFTEDGVQIGQVRLHYCNSASDVLAPPDTLDRAVAALVMMLLMLAGAGTVHGVLFEAGVVKENRFAMAFSLVNNWHILQTGGTSGENFDSLQGLRFLTMFLIIGAHGFLMFAHGYIANPEFIEQLYEDPLKVWMLNGRVVVQTFFVMSGFLLAHNVLKDAERKPLRLAMLPSAFLNRSFRLLPTTMVTVGLTATWVYRAGSGPLWEMMVGKERGICRSTWWKQLLFVQNNYAFDEVCLPQTWYLATDTQLYLISFVILAAVCRFPERAWMLLGGSLVTGLLLPALHTYLAHMMPVRASLFPETFVNLFVDNPTFVYAYMSAQANWAGYTLGMITAYIHHQAEKHHWDLQNSMVLKRLYQLSIPLGAWTIWLGSEFHSRPASRLEAALFNSFDHNLFAACICVFILGCIYKFDKLMRGVVEWGPLQPLGRLSFCALLLHTIFLRTYIGHIPELMHASIYNILFIMSSTIVLTFGGSVVLYLLVEQPACQIQRILLGVHRPRRPHAASTCQAAHKQFS